MQNKDGKRFTRKKGAMLLLSLCLVGAAAVSTYYAMDLSEDRAEEEYMVDLNENPQSEETQAEAVLAPEVTAELADGATEMDVDPSTLVINDDSVTVQTETEGETEMMTESGPSAEDGQSAQVSDASGEENEADEETADVISGGVEAQIQPTVSFASTESLQWPVAGTLLMDYSMDSTVYFATLDQYKYNPALVFGAEEGAQVVASAKGIIDSIATDEETGTTIRMNLGDNYTLIYGKLKEVTVSEGDVVEAGQLLGYVSQPTKYYCEEGPNLYFAMEKDGVAEDPFLYLE